MSIPAIWTRALESIGNETLSFSAGLRHTVAKGYYCPTHSHPAVEIIHHATGAGTTCVAGNPQDFTPGSVLVHAPEELHDEKVTVRGEDLCVQILLPENLNQRLRQGFFVREISAPWLVEDIQQLSQTQARPGTFEQKIFDLRATAVLLELTRQAATVSTELNLPPAERHVLQAEQYIGDHFASIRSLEDVAAHVGITHDHLRHIYKKRRGESLIRHLGKVRVARAKTLLMNSPLPLKQIAGLCGFHDEYYFSASFRRLVSMSPSQYRQKSREAGSPAQTRRKPTR